MYTRVRQQVGRFSMRNNRAIFFFIFTDENPELPADLPEQKGLLRRKFENTLPTFSPVNSGARMASTYQRHVGESDDFVIGSFVYD